VKTKKLPQIIINAIFILFAFTCIVRSFQCCRFHSAMKMTSPCMATDWSPKFFLWWLMPYVLFDPSKSQRLSGFDARCIIGTVFSVMVIAGIAYPLSRPDLVQAAAVIFHFFVLLFNGGLVPTYMLITNYLHLKDTIWCWSFLIWWMHGLFWSCVRSCRKYRLRSWKRPRLMAQMK